MKNETRRLSRSALASFTSRAAAVALLITCAAAWSSPVRVSVNTSALAGSVARLAIDLIDGDGVANNTVIISGFSGDALLGSASTVGDVSGTLPGAVTLADTNFFTELLQGLVLGVSFSFTLDISTHRAAGASVPDGLSIFLLDDAGATSLVTTDLPGDALMTVDIDGSSRGTVSVPGAIAPAITITLQDVEPRELPEPRGLALLGLCAMWLARRHPVRRA